MHGNNTELAAGTLLPSSLRLLVLDKHTVAEKVDKLREDSTPAASVTAWRALMNHRVQPSVKAIAWIGNVLLWAAGMHEAGSFKRWFVEMVLSGLMTLSIVNRPSWKGILVDVREFQISKTAHMVIVEPKHLHEKRPILIFYHGGGFCIGSPKEKAHFDIAKYIASMGYVVACAGYGLAPESPFPTGIRDAHTVLKYLAENAGEIAPMADMKRVIIGGDSAGGNLALNVTTLWRDDLDGELKNDGGALKQKLAIQHLILLYPSLLLPVPTSSILEKSHAMLLPYWLGLRFLQLYLPDEKTRDNLLASDRRLCPLLAGMHDLPLTTLVYGDEDPFFDECTILFEEMTSQGTPIIERRYDSGLHGFASLFGSISRLAQEELVEDLSSNINLAFKPSLR